MFRHFLVPTDGSPLSTETADKAIAFAKETGARITFFYAQPDFPLPLSGEGALFNPAAREQFLETARKDAEQLLVTLKSRAADAGVTADGTTVANEQPYKAIIACAQERQCDLIFMASHGRRGISGMLLGSETQKVLTHSKIPVLIYR